MSFLQRQSNAVIPAHVHFMLIQDEQPTLFKPLVRKRRTNPAKSSLQIQKKKQKGKIETASSSSFDQNPSFWTGLLSLLTFQSQVAFNYPMTQRAGQPASQLDCLPRANLEPRQTRADFKDRGFDTLRDSSRAAVWGLQQLSVLALDVGPGNIQHIPYMANIFWPATLPVKIHSFPGIGAGLHPGYP